MLVVANVHLGPPALLSAAAMQAPTKAPGQQAPVKIYNAVYSSVQVSRFDAFLVGNKGQSEARCTNAWSAE